MGVAQRLQPPGAGVVDLDADSPQQRPHVGRVAQVAVATQRRVGEHQRVTTLPGGLLGGRVGGSRPDGVGDDRFGRGPVDGQTVGGQLGRQQLGGRLGASRRQCRVPGEPRQAGPLESGRDERGRGPAGHAARAPGPPAGGPFRPEVAVGPGRVLRVVAFVAGVVEQPELAERRDRRRRTVVESRPHPGGVGLPPAGEQAVDGGDVPGPGDPDTAIGQGGGRRLVPPHPSGPAAGLGPGHERGRIGVLDTRRPVRRRDTDHAGGDGDGDVVTTGGCRRDQALGVDRHRRARRSDRAPRSSFSVAARSMGRGIAGAWVSRNATNAGRSTSPA